MTTLEVIGYNLSKYRKQRGYTQEALANDLFMSACNIRKIERGTGNPTVQTLEKLADSLGIEVEALFVKDTIA